MTPLDDELRTTLSTRTGGIEASPDLFAGVERRARRMRRQRVAAGVAGSALAAGALGVGGPMLASSLTSTAPGPLDQATSAPTSQPVPTSRYVLDPASPWAFRGDRTALENGNLETSAREWGARNALPESDVRFVPLYGEVDEPSASVTLVFLAEGPGLAPRWGVVQSSESGPEFLLEQELTDSTTALPFALAGEAVSRLVVVAHESTAVEYCPTGAGSCRPSSDGGIGRAAMDADPARDAYRVLAPDGSVLDEAPAPEPVTVAVPEQGESPPDLPPGTPMNAVDWPTRGSASPQLVDEALRAFARDTGTTREQVDGRLLYGSDRDGRNLLLLSAWQVGQDARVYGYLEAAGSGSGFLLDPSPGPAALGLLLPAEAVFDDADWLLVVPEPAAGQVLYAADGTSEPQPVADQGTEAAVVIERTPGASGDRLLVLDGDGDPERPILRGTVADLLASMT